ncbi:hypothetical protein FAZ95_04465 [Trinickia violacea]|uniref:Uncharacterized protein n=1 Tax=Trinickia violacea TaxID=2571746 RepID=A0A4V1EGZ7_9BURK|nr:hypothetical protein FAZ95_04465 [Trinickia violacea]
MARITNIPVAIQISKDIATWLRPLRLWVSKKGCNAGKPWRILNIGRPIIRVTMRPFSRPQGLLAMDLARRRRPT